MLLNKTIVWKLLNITMAASGKTGFKSSHSAPAGLITLISYVAGNPNGRPSMALKSFNLSNEAQS
jgi:hypothetical protein